ncbi:MAG: hypothetical protein E7433_00745 [Ruminococcaceae bacterium]|nr:hypothetical protein [Oscillospiraceae bacterium]
MTTKRIVLIIMCAMLALTVIMAGIVIGRVSPVLGALLGSPDPGTQPTTQPSTGQTTGPSTQPTTIPTTTTQPTTNPTTAPTTRPTDPGHVHAFVLSETQEATCEDAGFSIYICPCGEKEIKDLVPAKGHSFGPGKKVSATCEEKGYTLFTCRICGWEEERDYEEPTEHDYELTNTVTVSCEEDGYEEYTCKKCDSIKLENEQKATGHDFQVVGDPVEGSCTEEGYTLYKCNNPDCEEEKKDDVIPAPGHDFGDWEIIRDPEPGIPGKQSRKCDRCEEEEFRPLTVLLKSNKAEDGATGASHYFITATSEDRTGKDVTVYTYDVYNYGSFALSVTYDNLVDELTVKFTDPEGTPQEYVVTPGVALVIDADGKIVTADP